MRVVYHAYSFFRGFKHPVAFLLHAWLLNPISCVKDPPDVLI